MPHAERCRGGRLAAPKEDGVRGAFAVKASHRNAGASVYFFESAGTARRIAAKATRANGAKGRDALVYRAVGRTLTLYARKPERAFEANVEACLSGRQVPVRPDTRPGRPGPVKPPMAVARCLEAKGVRGVRTVASGLDPDDRKAGLEATVVVRGTSGNKARLYFFRTTLQAKRIAGPAEAAGLPGIRVGRVVLEFPPEPVGRLEDHAQACLQ